MKLIILSGISGSGKTTAVKALEDDGFYCIDNLPVRLFKPFIELFEKNGEQHKGIVLVADIRGIEFLKGYEVTVKKLKKAGHQIDFIFIDATDDVLIRRYSETRRKHPALNVSSIQEGIRIERELLAPLRLISNSVIDTSELSVHQLKELIIRVVNGEKSETPFTINIQSFGFRYGIPLESNIVMDVRFLPNPFFISELKDKNGLDNDVREYVLSSVKTAEFLEHFFPLINFLIPQYQKEGKAYLTISIGCTGGKHRSVAIADATAIMLEEKFKNVRAIHRDIDKG